MPSVVSEPHAAVACDQRGPTLNLVAAEGEGHRRAVTELAREHPDRVLREVRPLLKSEYLPLFDGPLPAPPAVQADLRLPARHTLTVEDLDPSALKKVLLRTYEGQAADF